MINRPTIKLDKPNPVPFFWTFFFIIAICLIFEILSGFRWFNSLLPFPSPSINSAFPELDVKFSRLQNAQGVDCLFFGSSMMDADLDPRIIESVLNQKNGTHYSCFNMGFSGSMIETSGLVATTLSHWQPIKIVILGISPIEMDKNFTKTRSIAQMPIFSYYNGSPSMAGWLFNTFRFPWYFAALPRTRDNEYLAEQTSWDQLLDDKGVRRSASIGAITKGNQDIRLPGYKINPVDLEVLESTIEKLHGQGIKVVVVEMPVHPDSFPYLIENGYDGYQSQFLDPINQVLEKAGIQLLRTQPVIKEIFDDSNWYNNNHLNFAGAEILSRYVAQQIVLEGIQE
jgi:hypothetical protein